MPSLRTAARGAKTWLSVTEPKDETEVALQELGLWLCDQISCPAAQLIRLDEEPVNWLTLDAFVNASRGELLYFLQAVILSARGSWLADLWERELWAQFMGGIALSYARVNDVVVVAALIRAAAHLDISGAWLTDVQRYLLDQQQPDGSFGLLDQEIAVINQKDPKRNVVMRLTVEVLWALAEMSAQRRRRKLEIAKANLPSADIESVPIR